MIPTRIEIVIPRSAVTEGEQQEPERCMIALPANRQLNPLGLEVAASPMRIRVRPFGRHEERVVYATDETLNSLIRQFDTGDREGILAEMPEEGYRLVLDGTEVRAYLEPVRVEVAA